jgi:drug/metabolite transporter (DMT)-like permease
MDAPKTMDDQDWGMLILLSVLWGGAYFFAGVAVKELPPLTVVLARVSLAAIALLPVFWYFGHALPRSLSCWLPFLGMGLLNNVLPFGFIFAGQTQITVGLSSIINAMTPLITVVVMASFQEERLTAYRIIGVVLGVAGVAVLRGFDGPVDSTQTLGIALCLAAALSYGFAALWGRKFLAGVPPVKSATCQLIGSSLIMIVVVSVIDQPWTLAAPSQGTIFALVMLAVFGTALAYIFFPNSGSCRGQQCHARDLAHSGNGAVPWQRILGRTYPIKRDHRCLHNRSGALVHRRSCDQAVDRKARRFWLSYLLRTSGIGPLLPVHDRQLLEELQPVSRFVPRPAASEGRAVVISARRAAEVDP